MLNLLDQLLGLTAKVLELVLDWPFLLFVFLVWVASRYRDQIGSTLDRRGAIKRSELSSAIRDELDPINRDIGNLKPDVSQMKTKLAKIDASQSEYAYERLLEPITAKVKALEETARKMQSDVERLSEIDVNKRVLKNLEPVNADMDTIRQNMEQLTEKFGPVNESVENLGHSVSQMGSRLDSISSTDSVEQLQVDMKEIGKELAGLTEAIAVLKSEVETRSTIEEAPARLSKGRTKAKASRDAELIPLRVMKDALASTRWEWRRVKKLASIAGLSENKAVEMLESDPELIVKKDDWGRRIAKLSNK